MEYQHFGTFLLFALGVGLLCILALPVLNWRNNSETRRLLEELVEEQAKTNALLGEALRRLETRSAQQGAEALSNMPDKAEPEPESDQDFTLE